MAGWFFVIAALLWLLRAAPASGQITSSPAYSAGSESSSSSAYVPSARGSAQNPFAGSVAQGKASAEVLPLSFSDAIDRGLKNNLGVLLASYDTISARGQRWKELSDLLPNVSISTSENAAQDNLAARGIRAPGIPTIVGPYSYFDARAYLSQPVLNLKGIYRERGARSNEKAAAYNYKDARELVVLAVGNAYLQALAGEARVATAQAQLQTAQALYDKAVDQQHAGVSPAIDTLRAQVELQSRQQQLIAANNDFAKQKLALARVIGLPPGQEFSLTDKAPYQPLTAMSVEESLQRAYTTRSDYLAVVEQARAAERYRRAASAEYFPSIGIDANYGDLGITPGDSHGTFLVTAKLSLPLFQGGKIHADVLQAEAGLRQSQSQLDNLRGQIDYEVRAALLDLNAAAQQVEVARSSVGLADQTLAQARDRFAAGVTDNLEVVQAQQAVASANENYIAALYAHNLAKIEPARAIGYAEQGVKQYLKGK